MKKVAILLALLIGVAAVGWLLLRPRGRTVIQTPPSLPAPPVDGPLTVEQSSERALAFAATDLGVDRTPEVDAAMAKFNAQLSDDSRTAARHADLTQSIVDSRLDRAAGLYWEACDEDQAYAGALLSLLFDLYDEGAPTQAAIHLGKQALGGEDRVGTHRNLAAVMWAIGSYHSSAEQVELCQRAGGDVDELFLDALGSKGVRVPG
ncbi:MAG TPA: hypothetical protein QGH10_18815 [Armatimonadota bacterium]|nr:hypothetical protein [Armatimonadota bacterium]